MEEIENDFLVDNIQKNTNQESQLHNQCDEEQVEYNSQLFSDELFNRNQIKISNKSSFQNIKLSPNNNDAIYNESPQKQNNADISGLSLLKELEDRWDIVEKRKMYYYNKNNDVQNNYINIYNKGSELKEKEKYKAIKDLVEKNKNIFIFKQNNARKKRENDNEIEQFFLTKYKLMDKYKIFDDSLKEQINQRMQEKNFEENNNNMNNLNNINNDNNFIDNINDDYIINENIKIEQKKINPQRREMIRSRKSYLKSEEELNNLNNHDKQLYSGGNIELDNLMYETPARDTNENFKNNYNINEIAENNDNNYGNEDIINMGLSFNYNNNTENNLPGKLIKKIKNVFEEISKPNIKINNTQIDKNNNGIDSISPVNKNFDNPRNNNALMNIIKSNTTNNIYQNNNNQSFNNLNNNNTNINNTSINMMNNNNILPNNLSQNESLVNTNTLNNEKTNLCGLQQNFDNILKKLMQNNQNQNTINNINNSEQNDNLGNPELDRYFEELKQEADFKLKQYKNIKPDKISNSENRIKKIAEESVLMLNNYANNVNNNKNNKFKQRMIGISNILGGVNNFPNRNINNGDLYGMIQKPIRHKSSGNIMATNSYNVITKKNGENNTLSKIQKLTNQLNNQI